MLCVKSSNCVVCKIPNLPRVLSEKSSICAVCKIQYPPAELCVKSSTQKYFFKYLNANYHALQQTASLFNTRSVLNTSLRWTTAYDLLALNTVIIIKRAYYRFYSFFLIGFGFYNLYKNAGTTSFFPENGQKSLHHECT